MKTKQLIALILAAGLMMVFIAGCNLNPENPRDPVVRIDIPTVPADLDIPDDLDELSDEEREELREALGLDEDMQFPIPEEFVEEPTEPPPPPATTMPAGSAIQQNEVYPMLRNFFDTMTGGRYYMRVRMTVPDELGLGTISMAMARDGDSQMQEMTMDWLTLLQLSNDGRPDFGRSRVQAAAMNTLMGRRVRIVATPENSFIAFPDRNAFVPAGDFAEEMGEEMFGMDDMPDLSDLSDGQLPDAIRSERVTVGGREYVSATWRDDGTSFSYFFHDGQLRRMEVTTREGTTIIEIDEFHGSPDGRLFSSQGMRRMLITELAPVFGGLGR